jgi:hypothetical protein
MGTILRPIQISIRICGWRWDCLVDPKKNRVYGLSNTMAKNLWSTYSVSTVGSSPSVSSTQSEEFIALKQQYQQLSTNYEQLRQIVMEMRSKMGDDTCAAPFWPYGPGNNQPPPPAPPLF